MNKNKVPSIIGAIVGFSCFLMFAALQSVVYGGYAGLLLAGGIFGTPIPPILAARGLIVFGMILAITAVGFFFTVAGATTGALAGFIIQLVQKDVPVEMANKKEI